MTCVKASADTDAFGQSLTPKEVSLVQIGDAAFIKADLSNYDLVRQGFTITVPYGNAIDAQTGTEHSPFLVVADNLNSQVEHYAPFTSDDDPKVDSLINQLITQEGINPQKTSYVGTKAGIYVLKNEQWVIAQGRGMSSATMVSDNQSWGVKKAGEQAVDRPNAENFNIYGSLINAESEKVRGAVEIVNIPDVQEKANGTQQGSEFTPVVVGPAKLTVLGGGSSAAEVAKSAKILYRLSAVDLNNAQSTFDPNDGTWVEADVVTDWSKVKAVAMSLLGKEIPPFTSLRLAIPLTDPQISNHVDEVHLRHGTQAVADTKTVSRTIHYQYADGSKAHDDVVQTATFSRTGAKDLVTNTTAWGAWAPADDVFAAVTSPIIAGYTADKSRVDSLTVTLSDNDSEVVVIYRQNNPSTPDDKLTDDKPNIDDNHQDQARHR